ncbi:ewing's tumor-associated antigen 1 isoform X1 [Astyanax mexicanus]|uniref:ETAA1 activator of ATR kinase n=1 Tax=Astyanax mexicanus TaxID=7994 RepID=A0A3B1IPB8_ASTMX|nr:ewing's tumor-associated antigen 1 isoform X1 [Astyanax mexicanus]
MTDRRTAKDGPKESWSRVCKLSQDKFKAQKYSRGRKQPQSPLLATSLSYRKDYDTPKHRSRIRFKGSSTGDSPSEAEALQDIIWDASSPPPLCNAGSRFVEISDIVNRIAPNDEKPVNRDLVLQWIGDSAVPCTPEIQQPRGRRISARRQSNNVEDLMKLAKQFDINMTRQDEERHRERLQEGKTANTSAGHVALESVQPSTGAGNSVPVKSERLSHEEELHALFDGPTQYVSGRLSPPSVSCSPESTTEGASLSAKRPGSTADSKNIGEGAAQLPKPDFDDDWENDDLLNDSFVLAMTQNPELLSLAPKSSSPQTVSNPSTLGLRPNAHVNTGTVQQLLKSNPISPFLLKTEAQNSFCKWQQGGTAVHSGGIKTEDEGSWGVGAKQSGSSTAASGKDCKTPDSVWGDGDDDDDLLYQACDDVERISSSQEERQQNRSAVITSNKASSAPSSKATTSSTNISVHNKSIHPGQTSESRQPARMFGRSHSIPGASSSYGNKQNLHETTQTMKRQYQFTQVKHVSKAVLNPRWITGTSQETRLHSPSAENSSSSHHSTFKRHQSDPVALSNKVFVAAQPVVKCTAAEIERKKQEAIARRRSRLQASQKPGAPV